MACPGLGSHLVAKPGLAPVSRSSEPQALLSALPRGAPCSHEALWENQGGGLMSCEAFFQTQKAGAHFLLMYLDIFL